MIPVVLRSVVLASLVALGSGGAAGCGGDDGGAVGDAGLDAIRRLAITVEGPAPLTTTTRSVTVTITVTNNTRMESFPVAGLPSTVDLESPIQLGTWMLTVDSFDMNGQRTGRGMASVASGTAETTVTLAPL